MSALLDRARRDGAPVIDGTTATFVATTHQPPALVGDFNSWDPARSPHFERVDHGVWAAHVQLPPDAYVEYSFRHGERGDPDPLCRRRVPNGFGNFNSAFYMPEATPSPLLRPRRGTSRGRVSRHVLRDGFMLANGHRLVELYHPPVPGPYALLVVFDGPDYRRRAQLCNIVDNLLAERRIRPLALALLDHGEQARIVEYSCSDATLGFITQLVLPLARAHLPLLDLASHPGAFGTLGGSMGGLMALYTALRLPQIFGQALCQSGAFTFRGIDAIVYDLVAQFTPPPIHLWMDCGTMESLRDCNRRMHTLLCDRAYQADYHEYSGGHSYTAWGEDVWRGLEALFPPHTE